MERIIMITIEEYPFSRTEYSAGVYTDETAHEWEFTISVSRSDMDIDTILEVTWTDGEPDESVHVTNDIWENWDSYIDKTE